MISTLPGDIHTDIASYLLPLEALNFAKTCSRIHNDLSFTVFEDSYSHQRELQDQHWYGPYVDGERTWFRFMPMLLDSYRIHTIRFECDYVDQGWGNRKSKLYIREDKNESDYKGDVMTESGIAEHHETHLSMEFQPKPGKNYTMCFYVGGGGGHELFVRNSRIRLLLYHCDPILAAVGTKFKREEVAPMINFGFGMKMLLAVIDSLIGGIEDGRKGDEGVMSVLASVGFETSNIHELKAMKQFLSLLHQFREKYPNDESKETESLSSSSSSSFSSVDEDEW
jgi:hypothetical protein